MREQIERVLPRVEKPARYLGNEWNAVHKDHDGLVTIGLAFPDVYEVAMSHLGLQILYHIANKRMDAVAERVFAPWIDMEAEMRRAGLPLFALESGKPVRDFDLLGFTLQYEMSYTNILNMLELAGIPLLASERTAEHPLVMAGGPCAYNPEPLADFLDFVVLGEAEESLEEVIQVCKGCKAAGASRKETLEALSRIAGVYVPAFYQVAYQDDGCIAAVEATQGAPASVRKRVVDFLKPEYYPTSPVVPYMGTVHDRLMLEIFRGCTRGCRFCQAGMIYRPVRERTREELLGLAQEALKASGHNEVSLMSLSTMDYSDLENLLGELLDKIGCEGVSVSLPSLRADSFSVELAKQVHAGKRSGLTLAPEAGSQRLRDVINKQVTEDDFLAAINGAQEAGWQSVKLYFMIGLPTENWDDIEGIYDLARKAVWPRARGSNEKKAMKVTVSTSSFVPKPWTPFQWDPQDSMHDLEKKQRHLRDLLYRERNITYKYHDADLSFLEAVFARGDRRLGTVLLRAHELGCKFDGWSEHFSYGRWMQAFADCETDPTFYANRERSRAEIMPWDHLSPGLEKDFLWKERELALAGAITPDCRLDHCPVCGACQHLPAQTRLAKE